MVCGLLLICGLCFGIGYTSGRRNGLQMVAAKVAASGKTIADQAATSLPKPAATSGSPAQAVAAPGQASDTTSAASVAGSPAAQANTSAVHPALPSSSLASASSAASQVQPALASASSIMVQIAAVSHMEDANVLMGALIKRGYAVTARRETGDSLIHVQVGPFASSAEANAMAEKLLNDGYNAVVMP
jgi:DedD protein